MEEFTDRYLDKPKQDVINTFNQGHLIKAYAKLESEQRMALLSQMELIQFDMIDMVAGRSTGLPQTDKRRGPLV